MPRFFISQADIEGDIVNITGKNAEHMNVLRMKIGEAFVASCCDGIDIHCKLTDIQKKSAFAEVLERKTCTSEASIQAIIYAGMPKGDKSDTIVQKCTEAGAVKIVFYQSDRSVSRPDEKSAEKKRIRWQRIAEEAAMQSGRGIIPEVAVLGSYNEMLNDAKKSDLSVFLYETGEERVTLRDTIEGKNFNTISIISGPEGGFEEFETEKAREMGFAICELGPRILRCETAPLCALTAIMYATSNL